MDRRTQISIDDGGIIFQNGLRNVHLEWVSINSLKGNAIPMG